MVDLWCAGLAELEVHALLCRVPPRESPGQQAGRQDQGDHIPLCLEVSLPFRLLGHLEVMRGSHGYGSSSASLSPASHSSSLEDYMPSGLQHQIQ